jgi:hypothetical protein
MENVFENSASCVDLHCLIQAQNYLLMKWKVLLFLFSSRRVIYATEASSRFSTTFWRYFWAKNSCCQMYSNHDLDLLVKRRTKTHQ